MTLNVQFLTLGTMILCGAGLGLLFDIYRVLSREFRFPRWLTPPLDLLFWLAGTLAVFRVLFASNGGEVRPYVFLGIILGIAAYFAIFSNPSIQLLRTVIIWIKRFVRFMIRLGELLIVAPIIGMYQGLVVILGFLLAFSIFLGKLVLQLLHPLWKMLCWIFRAFGQAVWRWSRARDWLLPVLQRISRWIPRMKK